MKQKESKKKEAILRESFRLFLSKGYDAVSLTDIERVAKVTRGAIFHHFDSKEDLFKHVAEKFIFVFLEEREDYGEEYLNSPTPLKVFMNRCLTIIEERMEHFQQKMADTEVTSASFMSFILYLRDHYDGWDEKVQIYEEQKVQAWVNAINLSKEKKEIHSDTDALLFAKTLHHLYLGLSYKGAMIDKLSVQDLQQHWEYAYKSHLTK